MPQRSQTVLQCLVLSVYICNGTHAHIFFICEKKKNLTTNYHDNHSLYPNVIVSTVVMWYYQSK